MLVSAVTIAAAVAVGAAPEPARAAPGDAFPVGPGLVFIAQGVANTQLFKAVQGLGQITFNPEGGPSGGRYNAMAFNPADMYLYAMRSPDSHNLLRIGQGGVVTGLGPVTGLIDRDYNQATFGTDGFMYVRDAAASTRLFRIDVNTRTATALTLQAQVPNVSDIVWKDGFIWSVFEGRTVYRINPSTGAVSTFPLSLGLGNDPYGAQWVYGNGNIGISNNITGRVYQLGVTDPTGPAPTFRLLSSIPGTASTNNDGASYPGQPADLAVAKSAPATFSPGGTVAYSITITNTGPGTSSGWILTDPIPAGLTNVSTTYPGCGIAAGIMTCSGGTLAPGQAVTLTFSGTTPTDPTGPCITNTVQILGNEPDPDLADNTDDAQTCPGVEVRSFSVQKRASRTIAHPGDPVTYTISVVNDGSVDFTGVGTDAAGFTDDLGDIIDDATLDDTSITGGATYAAPILTWSGPLAVGEHHEVSYTVTVNATRTDHTLTNSVVPDPPGQCLVASQCTTTIPVAAFAVRKVALTPSPVLPGQRVLYRITVENTGGFAFTDATPASFSDDLTDDLRDAVLDVLSITGGASYTAPRLSWSGGLGIGAIVTVTYAVTVNSPDSGDLSMVNTVVTPDDSGGNCPAGSTDPLCTVTLAVTAYTVAKTVTLDQTNPAALVARYAVVVTNTGTTAYPAENPATFTDDLTGVLDDATYNGDASPGTTYVAPRLTWSGPLAVGASVTVTYSVSVHNNPITGDGRLRNLVAPDPGRGGACASATACATDTPIPVPESLALTGTGTGESGGLALTGPAVGGLLLLAAVLIGAGVLLRGRRRRRAV